MKIYIASDHAGFKLKEKISAYLAQNHYHVKDIGTFSEDAVNWVEYGAKGAQKVSQDPIHSRGILICGTGLGMSIVANKFKGIRAAVCHDEFSLEMSRRHNNANILTMGARIIDEKKALALVQLWLDTEFDGGRHQKRLEYLTHPVESNNFK